jgi:hypothetical protein
VSDIVGKAHKLESLLSLAEALTEEILRSLEPLPDHGNCAFSGLRYEGEWFGHVQAVDFDNLWTRGSVDDLQGATKSLECHTSMPAACAQICAKLKWARMLELSESYEDRIQSRSSGPMMASSPFFSSRWSVFKSGWCRKKQLTRQTQTKFSSHDAKDHSMLLCRMKGSHICSESVASLKLAPVTAETS